MGGWQIVEGFSKKGNTYFFHSLEYKADIAILLLLAYLELIESKSLSFPEYCTLSIMWVLKQRG